MKFIFGLIKKTILFSVLITIEIFIIALLMMIIYSILGISLNNTESPMWVSLLTLIAWTITFVYCYFVKGFSDRVFGLLRFKKKNDKDLVVEQEKLNKVTITYSNNSKVIEKVEVYPNATEQKALPKAIKKYDFITIDFETANNELKSACSIGIAAVKNNEIVNTFYTLLNPPIDFFDAENSNINGIYKKDVIDSPKFVDKWIEINEFIENASFVVAHNANFDMSVLKESLYAYNLEIPSFSYFDSISFCSKMHDGSSKKLSEMCKFFNVELLDHHNGLEDAKACASIVICALNRSRYKTIYSYLKGYPSIYVNEFSELISQKTFKSNYRKPKTRISDIEVDTKKFDINHPLYDKTCVITGKFESYDRDSMTKKILDVGGLVRTKVSKKTDFLIVGQQDNDIVGEDGMSNKEETAYELIEQGHSIEIIGELDFLDYFK